MEKRDDKQSAKRLSKCRYAGESLSGGIMVFLMVTTGLQSVDHHSFPFPSTVETQRADLVSPSDGSHNRPTLGEGKPVMAWVEPCRDLSGTPDWPGDDLPLHGLAVDRGRAGTDYSPWEP